MKSAVIGIGGVGGYLASQLAKNTKDVTVVARGKRGEAIRNDGLRIISDYKGSSVSFPKVVEKGSELEKMDVIFICVKNYSLEEVCEDLKGHVDPETILVPVMNGVDPGDRIRGILPENTVVDSLIYIVAYSNPDFSIAQEGEFANLRIGIQNADDKGKAAVEKVSALLKEADIDAIAAEDIQCEIWRKYILNCAYNVSTARYNLPIGPIREDKEKAADYEALVKEAYNVGVALGVNLKEEYKEEILHRFYYEHQYNAGSSLQRDMAAGRRCEIETFSGYIVKTARKLGIDVPVSEKYYQALLKLAV